MRDRATGRSLTPLPGRVVLDLVARAVPAVQGLGLARVPVGRAVLDLAVRVVPVLVAPVELTDRVGRVVPVPVVPADRVVPAPAVPVATGVPVDLAVLVPLVRAVLVDLAARGILAGMVPVGPVVLSRVDTDLADLAVLVQTDRAVLVQTSRAVRVDLTVPVDPAAQVDLANPVGLADPVVPDLMDRVDLAGRVAPVDRLRRRMCNTASTTAVAPSGVVPTTRRTGSAHRTTVPRLRRGNTDSGGTADLRPERRRLTGTGHRLLAAGTDRRLPAAGTHAGKGHHATSATRSAISDRSRTTATTPSRSSTRFSVGGVSGSSARGFRCTDLTAPSYD